MKLVRYHQFGAPDVLRVEDAPTPQPGPGEALVRVEAAGINFADTMQRRDAYVEPVVLPATPGAEVAGTVEAVGEGVTGVVLGGRVFALLLAGGGYAQYAVVPAAMLIPLPDGVDMSWAPALGVQGLTAYLLLHAADLRAGESVLIHAAAGGVGSLTVQLAKARGAGRVIATASSGEKLVLARALDADAGVDYTQADWPGRVIGANGDRGVDVVLDGVGGETFRRSLECLAPFGRLVTYGNAGGQPTTVDAWPLTTQNQVVAGFYLGGYFARPDLIGEAFGALFSAAADGRLRVHIGDAFPLEQAAEAHRRIEARQTTGKIILRPWS